MAIFDAPEKSSIRFLGIKKIILRNDTYRASSNKSSSRYQETGPAKQVSSALSLWFKIKIDPPHLLG